MENTQTNKVFETVLYEIIYDLHKLLISNSSEKFLKSIFTFKQIDTCYEKEKEFIEWKLIKLDKTYSSYIKLTHEDFEKTKTPQAILNRIKEKVKALNSESFINDNFYNQEKSKYIIETTKTNFVRDLTKIIEYYNKLNEFTEGINDYIDFKIEEYNKKEEKR